jgi:hypothetical protein
MELLIIVALLVALALLALRFGADSRDRPRGHEESQAAFGLTWAGGPAGAPPDPPTVQSLSPDCATPADPVVGPSARQHGQAGGARRRPARA